MGQLVLVSEVAKRNAEDKKNDYSAPHITLLLRQGKIAGQKIGGIWMVDIDSLKAYAEAMKNLGNKRFDPTHGND